MITPLDNQAWSSELVTGNAQFIEVGTTIYVVSQVRADNTFAVFKSQPTPPASGPGAAFTITATYAFPTVNGNHNSSFDPVVAYNATSQKIYIVGTQDNTTDGVDVLSFAYDTTTDTLGSPVTLVIAEAVRDSYDVCSLEGGLSTHFVSVVMTAPSTVWQTPTVSNVTSVHISVTGMTTTLTVLAQNSYTTARPLTFSGLQAAAFLNGVTITPTTVTNTTITAVYTGTPPWEDAYSGAYTQVAYESGFLTWLPGHSLVGFELNGSTLVTTHAPTGVVLLDSSPYRSGDAFGAVSCYSPDGLAIEVYYESHPKQVTFKDQIFSINLAARDSSFHWTLPSVVLNTFSGRYTDSRLTVIAQGTTRTLLQQYFSQSVHQNALVGSFMLGYATTPSPSSWSFQTHPGTSTTSYIQGTPSISNTQGAFVSYLAEPVYSIRGQWSPQVKIYSVNDRITYGGLDYIVNTAIVYQYVGVWQGYKAYSVGDVVQVKIPTSPVSYGYYTAKHLIASSVVSPNLDTTNWIGTPTPDADSRFNLAPTSWPLYTSSLDVSTFNMVDVPGFYNTLNFTWLRGAKTVLEDSTKWGVVGEQILEQGGGDAVFGARYVSAFDTPPVVKLTPDTHSGSTTVLRGTPFLFDASQTNDANLDPLTFVWTLSPTNSHVTLTPNAPSNATANLLVNRSIGGSSYTFTIGVVATTSNHIAMEVVNIGVSGNVLTVGTTASVSLAASETVFLSNIGTATFLNNQVVTVTGTSGSSFTATFTHADYASTADTGNAIVSPQFDWCRVSVPVNTSPTITFPTNPISAARNSVVTITPTYTGTTDADDATTYTWTQVSGTPVTVLGGMSSPTLQMKTTGVLVQGEPLVWQLTVNDGVNPAVSGEVTVNVAPYPFQIQDTQILSRSLWGPAATISQRNTVQTWVPLSVSATYSNFQTIKRSSVLDGADRYLILSPASVCVYGGHSPTMLLSRRLFVPPDAMGNQNAIVDAVHTEDDTTLVLDSAGNLYRYTVAPLINTDNPDTTLVLSSLVNLSSFNRLFSTYSFNNTRILILTGVDGCLILQVQNLDMKIQGLLELTVESGGLYGIDNVQFIRTSNVESLNSGKILLGTVAQVVAVIQSISISNNTVTVRADNNFTVGQVIAFQNLTQATFLDGVKASIVSATANQFVVSYEHNDYTVTSEGVGATAVASGKTYETLIDLSHGQIIGTFDTSSLHNQYVTTGEILFEPNDTYAGAPGAPVLNPIVNNGSIDTGHVKVTISWTADRPDLIQYYDLDSSLDGVTWTTTKINSGYIESTTLPEFAGQYIRFRVRAVSIDGTSPWSNIETIET